MILSRLSIDKSPLSWILVDENNFFLETQCLAIAEAMDFPARLYRVSLPRQWKYLPVMLIPNVLQKVNATPKPLTPPWPSFIICGGKAALKIGNYLRKKYNAYLVGFGPTYSSCHKILIESHQPGEKGHKIMTLGPLSRIHPENLVRARQTFYRKIDHLPKPRVGLFLEGKEPLLPLIDLVNFLYKKNSFSLMVHGGSLSEEGVSQLSMGFKAIPHFIWMKQKEDPYLGFLAHSDVIIVSNISSLMLAEVSSTGKPFFIYPACSSNLYAQTLLQQGYAELLTYESSFFSRNVAPPPLRETQRIAQIIKEDYLRTLGKSSVVHPQI